MARVKTARTTRARHKKILKQAKGYLGAKHYRYRNANHSPLAVQLVKLPLDISFHLPPLYIQTE